MVQVGDWSSTARIKTCRIHNLVRDFALSKASGESFLQLIDSSNKHGTMDFSSSNTGMDALPISRFRMLSIHGDHNTNYLPTLAKNRGYVCLRSLTCNNMSLKFQGQVVKPLVKNIQFLRVLKLENVEGLDQLPKNIGKLVYLKFLSIKHSNVEQLRSSIGNLTGLQTLDLRTTSNLELPNVMWKLKELRHLYLPEKSTINFKKLGLNDLRSLQTLINISMEYCDLSDLAQLTNLRRLRIIDCKDLEESYWPTIVTFNRLHSLSVKNICSPTKEIVPIILRYPRAYKIHVELPVAKLPEDYQFSPNLVKLMLAHTHLKDDPMKTLQKLPNLRILHVKHDAFLGFEMSCLTGGFPRLESLYLVELFHLQEWWVEKGALPSLCHLHIKCCQRLTTLPDGLKCLTGLEDIVIQRMPMEFKNRIGEGGGDFFKVQHVRSLVFLNTWDSEF